MIGLFGNISKKIHIEEGTTFRDGQRVFEVVHKTDDWWWCKLIGTPPLGDHPMRGCRIGDYVPFPEEKIIELIRTKGRGMSCKR
jgi:hypothetical protein